MAEASDQMRSFHSSTSQPRLVSMAASPGQNVRAESNRLATCSLPSCGCLFAVCSGCDRGRRYCSEDCARTARRLQQRLSGQRYQATERGRHAHALRQARYRARHAHVTHQPRGDHQKSAGTGDGQQRRAPNTAPVRGGHHRPPDCALCGRRTAWLRACFLARSRLRERRRFGAASRSPPPRFACRA